MDDLDFSQLGGPPSVPKAPSAASAAAAKMPAYDAALAVRFFRIAGEEESFSAGKRLFAENEKAEGMFSKGTRIYLLLEGQIALTLNGKPLHLILPGEIFGELALIANAPRSATATALKASRVLALDEKRFLTSLQQLPEFAPMLVGVLTEQLRRVSERLLSRQAGNIPVRENGGGLSPEELAGLRRLLGNPAPTPMRAGDTLVSKGALGAYMYVLTAGRVAVDLEGRTVERIGAGECFGELALVGPTSRAANVVVETEGAWLPLTRQSFLAVVKAQPATGLALLRTLSARLQHLNRLSGNPAN